MKSYTINHTDTKVIITITKAFAKEASIYNSPAYNTLKGLRADFPNCKVELKKIKRNPEKKTYGKLNYEKMKEYIVLVEGEKSETLNELEYVKKLARFRNSPYSYTKKWFLAKYPEFEPDVVEEEAKSAVAETAEATEVKELAVVENEEARQVA